MPATIRATLALASALAVLGCATSRGPSAPIESEGTGPVGAIEDSVARWTELLERVERPSEALVRERLEQAASAFRPTDVRMVRVASGRIFLARHEVESGAGEVVVLDSVGGQARSIWTGEALALEPSPSGSFVAILRRDGTDRSWVLLDVETGAQMVSLPGQHSDNSGRALVWFPDESGLCWSNGSPILRHDFRSGETREVTVLPGGLRSIDLRMAPDGAQVLAAAGRHVDLYESVWLIDLWGGPAIALTAELGPQPKTWRAVGVLGPLALILADDRGEGGRLLAIDRRRQGAPPITLVALEDTAIVDAAIAGGHVAVIHHRIRSNGWPGAARIAIHRASGELEREHRIGGLHSLGALRGDVDRPRWFVRAATPHASAAATFDLEDPTPIDAVTGSLLNLPYSLPVDGGEAPYRLFADLEPFADDAPTLEVLTVDGSPMQLLWLALGGVLEVPANPSREIEPATLDRMAARLVSLGLTPAPDVADRINAR